MNQLGLFDAPAPVTQAATTSATNEWWLGTVEERRAGALRSADFWQRQHDKSDHTTTEDAIYAANLRKMAADMELRPDYYEAKPSNVSDFQWWQKGMQQ